MIRVRVLEWCSISPRGGLLSHNRFVGRGWTVGALERFGLWRMTLHAGGIYSAATATFSSTRRFPTGDCLEGCPARVRTLSRRVRASWRLVWWRNTATTAPSCACVTKSGTKRAFLDGQSTRRKSRCTIKASTSPAARSAPTTTSIEGYLKGGRCYVSLATRGVKSGLNSL